MSAVDEAGRRCMRGSGEVAEHDGIGTVSGGCRDTGLALGVWRRQQRFQNVFPAQNAFEYSRIRGDGEARDILLDHQLGCRLDRGVGVGGNRVPAHDLMGPFVESGSITLGL